MIESPNRAHDATMNRTLRRIVALAARSDASNQMTIRIALSSIRMLQDPFVGVLNARFIANLVGVATSA
jgi:hypothetical protein